MATRRIVNIINFIRAFEPRDPSIDLFEPVQRQMELVKAHQLPATWLFQYDALTEGPYAAFVKENMDPTHEVGIWFETVQQLVEAAGLTWRGKNSWDWHGHCGFSIGYTPHERERLVDVIMREFKRIFGKYPSCMGSWTFDAHLLRYMHEQYGIIAACNCKDQIGTDGITLAGGYWNQAYYPSRAHALMPAQHQDCQIPVPVFRMLGSDPIDQYEAEMLGGNNPTDNPIQGVVSLEPVYPFGGGEPKWVDWFFDVNFKTPGLAFSYAQVGQENSFGWPAMEKGLTYQLELVKKWKDAGDLSVETLSESGRWFRKTFAVTPATAISVPKDNGPKGRRAFWYDSRFYRAHALWSEGTLRILDIHCFNEACAEHYLHERCTTFASDYDTLPVMDGLRWTENASNRAGIYPMYISPDGTTNLMSGNDPVFSEKDASTLSIDWPLDNGDTLHIRCEEQCLSFSGPNQPWLLEWQYGANGESIFTNVTSRTAILRYRHFTYMIHAEKGTFAMENNRLVLIAENGACSLRLNS